MGDGAANPGGLRSCPGDAVTPWRPAGPIGCGRDRKHHTSALRPEGVPLHCGGVCASNRVTARLFRHAKDMPPTNTDPKNNRVRPAHQTPVSRPPTVAAPRGPHHPVRSRPLCERKKNRRCWNADLPIPFALTLGDDLTARQDRPSITGTFASRAARDAPGLAISKPRNPDQDFAAHPRIPPGRLHRGKC